MTKSHGYRSPLSDSAMKWQTVRLEEVATIVGGDTPSRDRPEFWDGDIPWATPTDLDRPGSGITKVTRTTDYISEAGLASCSANVLPVGTVLFSSRATIGKLGINQVPLATNQGFTNFIPRSAIDRRFLAYSLMHHIPVITLLAGSTTFKEVSKRALRKVCISLPPISEQRRITEVLDQADALRKRRIEANAKVERILPALFSKLFASPSVNQKGWKFTTLADSGATVRYGLGQPPKANDSGLPLIRATNIRKGRITEKDMMYVERGAVPSDRNAFLSADEVIVVRSGAYTGDVAQVTERWAGSVAGYDLVIDPGEKFCSEFVEAHLLTPHIQNNYFGNLKARAGQPHLNKSQVSATPIPLPPKSLQLRFSDNVRKVRQIRDQGMRSTEQLEALFTSLQNYAFSGNLTAKWRESHMEEVLTELREQERLLAPYQAELSGHSEI